MSVTMTKQAAGRAIVKLQPMAEVPALAAELQRLQRERAVVLKSRNMQSNRLQAIVAGTLGYHSGMDAGERLKMFAEAAAVIKAVAEGTGESTLKAVIETTLIGIDAFNSLKGGLEKEMERVARQLPVAAWVARPEQRGFGMLFLAIVVGECGDLGNYANPAKVWKRMGCAPHQFNGKTAMGATWKAGKEGKLPAAEWEAFGYSPRRRSIAYLIGEGIVKQNGEGPYRARYDEAKRLAEENRPEWTACKCGGTGKSAKGKKCPECSGRGKKLLRCHRHGMLLATKMLLKELWCEWNGRPPMKELQPNASMAV
jgi:hypothetical protein